MRNAHVKWMVVMVMALAPAAAWAQHGHAPAPGAQDPAAPSTREAPAPDAGDAWLGDEWLAFDDEGDEAIWEEQVAPGGARRFMARGAHAGPGMGGMMHGRGGRHGGMGMGLHMRFAHLDLTDAQRAKLRDLHEAAMRKGVQRRADAQLARMDLHKQMRADNPSAAAVNTQIDKLARLHADALKARFDTYMQAREVLTPEQLKQFNRGPGAMRMQPGQKGGDSAK